MPKKIDIKKVLVIGSGPIVIGQAAEFDYAGTQACLALKEEGIDVILVNSNPATIMTDTKVASKVYMEPLDLEHIAKIIRFEKPDGIICSMGGQTALNLGMQLYEKGILDECEVKMLGTDYEAIKKAEDRLLFRNLCEELGEPVLPSVSCNNVEEVLDAAKKIGYPLILRPCFTLGGTGGGFAYNEEELIDLAKQALKLSPVSEVLVEKSIKGFKEIEYEVLRDSFDNALVVCNMENVDPVGIHTGDSIVVCPSQTLCNKEYQMLRNSALKIIRALKIEGGCNVQFSLDPYSFEYYVIEVNPRVSRSSALASKASGYPIARVSAKICLGMNLDEIQVQSTKASFEPALDYVVTKIPRFPFDKFKDANRHLSTQMKATGEVMSIGRTIEESLLKGIRSLETGVYHLELDSLSKLNDQDLIKFIYEDTDERIFAITEAFRRSFDLDEIYHITKIDRFFLYKLKHIVDLENEFKEGSLTIDLVKKAKRFGFSDKYLAKIFNKDEIDIFNFRKDNNIMPVYKMIDTCASEFVSYTPYFYSTYRDENESIITNNKKIIILGSGPIRIGQGVEFDYSTVHAIWATKELGYEAIVINNNPETVSTDYTMSDKLYFEPLFLEDVLNIIELEKPFGVVVSLGGQTAINLAQKLDDLGINIIGTSAKSIKLAEDRDEFDKIMSKLNIPMPKGRAVFDSKQACVVANQIGYPVLIRPSFVLGGRMMHIVYDDNSLMSFIQDTFKFDSKNPVLIDKYILGKECEVDAICDGKDVFIPGVMEHIEKTGVHSGDSMSIYPTYSLSDKVLNTIYEYTNKIGLGLGLIGLYNIQFIVDSNDDVYVIEVNPRSSRTVPFISKACNVQLAEIAQKVNLGLSLKEQNYTGVLPKKNRWYVKSPTFSFSKIVGLDVVLSPEMKSTGEAIGYDKSLNRALYKSLKASGMRVINYGTILATIDDSNKNKSLPILEKFYKLGFNICATKGTQEFLSKNNINSKLLNKIGDGSTEIIDLLSKGYITYVINTSSNESSNKTDGKIIRRTAIDNNIPVFTCLDTANVLLNVIDEITFKVSTIDEE